MNIISIKRIFIYLFIPLFSIAFSCDKVDVPELEKTKDEIIDSLTNHIDSLTQAQEEKDRINQSIPQSILILSKDVKIKNGYIAEIEFRVNPSTAEVDLSAFRLDDISAHTKGVNYVTNPVNIKKVSVQKSKNAYGSQYRGQYTMTIKDLVKNKDFTETLTIVYDTFDAEGNRTEVCSDQFTVTSEEVSSLPKVYITTPGQASIKSKTEWMEDAHITITGNDGSELLDAGTSIRGRGNSTWGQPKKPYALKLDSKAEVLGMPKHKRWVLLANWMDRTLLRNDVSFEMGRRIMSYAPRGEFVELYLNGKYQGNYYLCEQIKPDKNRVNVDEENGGYILEFDTYGPSDEINYFYTPVRNYPVTIKEPDEEVITSWEHPVYTYIYDYVGSIENLLHEDSDRTRWAEVEELLDITSYIDWWLIHEITHNFEPNHPKSSYMHKMPEGKLFAGPVWDFDWETFTTSSTSVEITGSIWYRYLFKYPEFKEAVKHRWSEVKESLETIPEYITEMAKYLEDSNEVNHYQWPITDNMNINGDIHMGYQESIDRMVSVYKNRMKIVDTYISKL